MLTKSIFIIAYQHTFQTHIFSEIHFNKQENIIIKQKLNFLDSKVHTYMYYINIYSPGLCVFRSVKRTQDIIIA